jgi:hypothetical protein
VAKTEYGQNMRFCSKIFQAQAPRKFLKYCVVSFYLKWSHCAIEIILNFCSSFSCGHRICTFGQRSFKRKHRANFESTVIGVVSVFLKWSRTAHVRKAFMGLFVGLGGGVFHVWEDWDLIEATYFSYVTLTTIGIGKKTFVQV